jgi:hypothetical protein
MTNARTGSRADGNPPRGADLVLQCKQPVKDESAEATTALEIFLDLF